MTIKNDLDLQPACESIKDFIEKLTFGEYVRNLRRADGMTQQELANRIGCKKQFISAIEKGREQVSLDFACRIAKAMGYPIAPFAKILFKEQLKQYAPNLNVCLISKQDSDNYLGL